MGAEVLEKHFTYHVRMPGDDHYGACTPETLAELVERIKRLEVLLGCPDKGPLADEKTAREALRVEMKEVGFE